MTKSNFKKSVMSSFQWRDRYCDTKKRHKTNIKRFFNFGPLLIKVSDYASVIHYRVAAW